MNMEMGSVSKLNAVEKELYNKFAAKNPGWTEEDFLELREVALSKTSGKIQKFFEVNGVVMENKPDADDLRNIKDQNAA